MNYLFAVFAIVGILKGSLVALTTASGGCGGMFAPAIILGGYS